MTDQPPLVTHMGYDIFVDKYGSFSTVIDELTHKEIRLKDLKEYINKFLKQAITFDPVDAIHIREEKYARITSREEETTNLFRITHIDRHGQPERGKRSLIGYHRGEPSKYVRRNSENEAILKAVWDLRDRQKSIGADIEALKKSFVEPLILADFKVVSE